MTRVSFLKESGRISSNDPDLSVEIPSALFKTIRLAKGRFSLVSELTMTPEILKD
jgi:hypothetical protein